MKIRLISSKENSLLKTMRMVASQARRAPEDLVLAEGIRTVEEATASGCAIEAVLIAEGFGSGERERDILSSLVRRQIEIHQAGEAIIRSVSDVIAPQGVIALVRVPNHRLAELKLGQDLLIVCACGVQDPGNLGALIRSAAAAGASLVCTFPGTVSARNTKTIRASAGAFFRIPVTERVSPSEFIEYSTRYAVQIFRTSAKEGSPYTRVDFLQASAIVLGNEGSGIPKIEWAGFPCVRIPMISAVESLNVAAAGAVLLFEARRQRTCREMGR